jgi:hypothetical protein
MVVTDASLANAFLIDHNWMQYERKDCRKALDHHINAIIKNVVDFSPFYNRSHGHDHFMINVYDHGAFCDMECSNHGDGSFIYKIANASFIGK